MLDVTDGLLDDLERTRVPCLGQKRLFGKALRSKQPLTRPIAYYHNDGTFALRFRAHALIRAALQRKTRRGKRSSNSKAARLAKHDDRSTLARADMHNERFATYYEAQKIIPDNEWDIFMESLRRPLPTTFRIAGSRQYGLSPFMV